MDSQGRHIAFSVGSPLSQPTLQQQHEAAVLTVSTAVPFTYVPAILTMTDPFLAVMMVPVLHVQPSMGMSWAQPPALPPPQLMPQPIPMPTTQAQVPPIPTAAPIFTYNVMENMGWNASTGGAAGSALLPPTLPVCSHKARRLFDRNQQLQVQARSQRGRGTMQGEQSAVAEWVYPAMDQQEIGMLHGSSTPHVPRGSRSGTGGRSMHGCKWSKGHGRRRFR